MATLPLFIYRSCLSIPQSIARLYVTVPEAQPGLQSTNGKTSNGSLQVVLKSKFGFSSWTLDEIICSKGIAEIQNTDSSRGLSTNSSLDTSSQIIPTDLSFIPQMDPLSSCSLSSALVALLITVYIINPDWLFFIWASPSFGLNAFWRCLMMLLHCLSFDIVSSSCSRINMFIDYKVAPKSIWTLQL